MELRDGILIVNKEANMTSHDVVNKLRRILKTKKIGHTGTLDPNATGVLIILVNKACKILPYLKDTDKEYIATMQLGKSYDTDDIWGNVLDTKDITPVNDLQLILDEFKGEIKQLPPMISSVKINGKKLYEYARNNEYVERELRDVVIHEIECLNNDNLEFRVHCGSGTYIRSLCVDIANKTNNLGYMSSLIRTKVGRFTLDNAYTLDDISNGNYELLPISQLLDHMHEYKYEPIDDIRNGKHVRIDTQYNDLLLLDENNEPLAVYQRHHDNVFKCLRGLW